MRTLIMAAALIAASAGAAIAQDAEKGEASFKKCRLCHAVGENAQNKIGPELNGLVGRHAGADFDYSDTHKNSAIVWGEASFKEYIRDPAAKVPGHQEGLRRHQG
jgi:cytochrome c